MIKLPILSRAKFEVAQGLHVTYGVNIQRATSKNPSTPISKPRTQYLSEFEIRR